MSGGLAEKFRQAIRMLEEGEYIEDVIEVARSAAYDLARSLLGGNVGEEVSLTEMSFRLKEKGLIDEETQYFLRELDRMLEMAHYDIWSMYTRDELIEKLRRLEEIAKEAQT